MRGKVLLGGCALVLLASATAFSGSTEDEREVRSALEHYLAGHATGDGAHYRLVFHPDSKLYFNRDGKFSTRTAEEYISGASGKPAPDEAQRKRRIVSVDVVGDAAQAKIELDYPTTFFTDYFNLLRVDGKWMIVNKTFHARTKK
ncbi:MAG: nuclear transport factor 2 family protein [Gemmatimonadaceae bacterium]